MEKKYRTFAKNVCKDCRDDLMYHIITDMRGNKIPVMAIPNRLVAPLIEDFLLQNPRGDISSWFGYVVYICIPFATEMTEKYSQEYGETSCSEWIGDAYNKIIALNPGLDYDTVEDFQEPVQNKKVVHVNFNISRRARCGTYW